MPFQDAMFLPSSHFLKFVVEVKASEPPHVTRLCLLENRGMFPVKYFAPTKPLFVPVPFHEDHNTVSN